jgi:DNA-binding PadR family transcriptional regulator
MGHSARDPLRGPARDPGPEFQPGSVREWVRKWRAKLVNKGYLELTGKTYSLTDAGRKARRSFMAQVRTRRKCYEQVHLARNGQLV